MRRPISERRATNVYQQNACHTDAVSLAHQYLAYGLHDNGEAILVNCGILVILRKSTNQLNVIESTLAGFIPH